MVLALLASAMVPGRMLFVAPLSSKATRNVQQAILIATLGLECKISDKVGMTTLGPERHVLV
jgi:ribosome recycling factor